MLRFSIVGTLLSASVAQADPVEIYLLDLLDNTQAGYCLDIAKGRGKSANPKDGLQGHTCYSPEGELGFDQAFDAEKAVKGVLHMTNFDVCAAALDMRADAALTLAECDASPSQSFVFSGEGVITPAAETGLCVTVGVDTRSGRSRANQIKALTLEPCSLNATAFQTWGMRGIE